MCKGWSTVDGWGSKEIFCQVLWVLCVYFAGLSALSQDLFSFRKETKNIFRRLHFKCLKLTTAPERSEMSAEVLLWFSAHACAFQHLHVLQLPPVWALSAQVWGKVVNWRGWEPGSLASTWVGNHEKNVRDAAEHSSWWVSAENWDGPSLQTFFWPPSYGKGTGARQRWGEKGTGLTRAWFRTQTTCEVPLATLVLLLCLLSSINSTKQLWLDQISLPLF